MELCCAAEDMKCANKFLQVQKKFDRVDHEH